MPRFDLPMFMPFRLNRLADEVSRKLSEVYEDRFGISVVEWRILTTLAAHGPCTAQHIVDSTRTHKSRISRGVGRLIDRELLERLASGEDRREVRLCLSKMGRGLHRKLVPVILSQEERILSCLTSEESGELSRLLSKLEFSLDVIPVVGDSP